MYQSGLDHYDQQRLVLARESADKFRRRWEGLTPFGNTHRGNGRIHLQDVPIACDRIPNPFGSLGGDSSAWSWLREIYDSSTTEDSTAISNTMDWVSCEVREVQEIASRLLDSILASSAEHPLSFFETVRRCTSLLAQGMNFILVDQYKSSSSAASDSSDTDKSTALQRIESATHRALITSTVLSVFNGGLRPHRRKDLGNFVEKMRSVFNKSTSASTAGSVNGGGNHGVHGLDRAWGPILIVTKLGDVDAWEAGCREIFKDFQLDILPYYGSDSDRIACRAYMRSLSMNTGGLNAVGSGLYCDRSHCHVVLMNYETLLLDAHYFKDICWFALVMDEPWGFLSSEKFHYARNQVFSSLRARHRIVSCASLTTLHHDSSSTASATMTTNVDVTDGHKDSSAMDEDHTDHGEAAGNDGPATQAGASGHQGARHQMPDLLAIVTLLCPYAMGLGFHHDSEQVFVTHHLQHLPNQQFYPAATTYNNYHAKASSKKPAGLPVRGAHAAEWLEIDGLSTYYLTRLLASITAYSSNSFLSYSSLTEYIPNPTVFDVFFGIFEQLHKIVPLLAWYGIDVHAVPLPVTSTDDECAAIVDKTCGQLLTKYKHVYRVPLSSVLPTNAGHAKGQDHLLLVLAMKDFAFNIMYHDQEFLDETQFINLKSVGQSGTNIQRIVVSETLKITESGEEVREAIYDKPKGISGRPRGKSRPKKATANAKDASSANAENLTSTEAGRADDAPALEDGSVAVGVKTEAAVETTTAQDGSSSRRIKKEPNVEEEEDDNDGAGDEEDEMDVDEAEPTGSSSQRRGETAAPVVPTPTVDAETAVDTTTAAGPPKKRARVSGPTDSTPAKSKKGAKDNSANVGMATPSAAEMPPPPTTPATLPQLSAEEEMAKAITRRGGFFFVSILQQSRHRFLGAYASEAEAQAVFRTALQHREDAGIASTHVASAATPSAPFSPPATSTNTATTGGGNSNAAAPMNMVKFKGKISKDMKLSDGSFISEEYHRLFAEEDLFRDICAMSKPGQAVDRHITDWTHVFGHELPSFGQLYAVDDPNLDPRNHSPTASAPVTLYLPATAVIFGQADPSIVHSLFEHQLETPISGVSGMIFDYRALGDVTTASSLLSSIASDLLKQPLPVVHVAEDASIAKYHALVRYNPRLTTFEITALHADATIFVDGLPVKLGDRPFALVNKSIVQLGSRSFIFCPPRPTQIAAPGGGSDVVSSPAPGGNAPTVVFPIDLLQLRAQLVRLLQEARHIWRRGLLPDEESLRAALLQGGGLTDAIVDWEDDAVITKVMETRDFQAIRHVLLTELEKEALAYASQASK